MKTQSLESAIEAIQGSVPDVDLRICRRIEIGTAVQQGDVYIHRVPDDWAYGERLETKQLAAGTTQGARHTIDGPAVLHASLRLPDGVSAPVDPASGRRVPESVILGPTIVATGAFTVPHPTHAHHRLPAGVYCVTYQVDMRTMRRVRD